MKLTEMQANAAAEVDPFNQMMAFIELESQKLKEQNMKFMKNVQVPEPNDNTVGYKL